jgi:hypothetical protein
MEVYFWRNGQGPGYSGICSTLNLAREALQRSILEHGKSDGNPDPDPWQGWVWWYNEDRLLMFGWETMQVAEGYIRKYTVNGPEIEE